MYLGTGKSDILWNWKLCHETHLWRKSIIVIRTVHSQLKGISFIVLYQNILIITCYLEKEEWKYCSMEISALWNLIQWSFFLLMIHWKFAI
jgi:hypothetical protein